MLSALLIATSLVMPSVGKGGKLSRVRSAVKGQPSRSSDDTAHARREPSSDRHVLPGRRARPVGRGRGVFPPRVPCCRYLDYPYFWGAPGYAYVAGSAVRPSAKAEAETEAEPQSWAGRLAAETSYDFDGLVRTGVRGVLLTPSPIEVHVRADAWLEPLPTGELDSLGLIGAGLAYRLGADERSQFRIGAAYRQLVDETGGQPGIRFFADANLFVGQPWVVTFTAGAGFLGDAVAWDLRGTAGALLGPVEMYLGYDYERLGDIPLGGPVLGFRLWL